MLTVMYGRLSGSNEKKLNAKISGDFHFRHVKRGKNEIKRYN